MPAAGNYNTFASDLLVALQPTENWQKHAQARQAELQYANIREARAQQEQQVVQNNIQSNLQTIAALKALPVESPDKSRINKFLDERLNQFVKRIETDYGNDPTAFIKAEMPFINDQLKTDLLSSPVYALAMSNKVEMDKYRKAITDRHELIGDFDAKGNYINPNQKILDYQNGVTDRISFRGAYDPTKANAVEYFGKNYAPGGSKFTVTQVSEEEKLAYAKGQLGTEAGMDYYYKNLRNRPVNYKVDPFEDKQMFAIDLWNKQLSGAQKQANIRKIDSDIANDAKAASAAANSFSYVENQFANPVGEKLYASVTNKKEAIPGFGGKLGDLVTKDKNGNERIVMKKFANIGGHEDTSKYFGTWGENAQVEGGIVLDNGGKAINLKGVKHKVLSVDSSIYSPEADVQKNIAGRPGQTYQLVTVQIPEAEAVKKGFVTNKFPFWNPDWAEFDTELSVGMSRTEDNDLVVQMYVPLPGYSNIRELNDRSSKAGYGVKNAFALPYKNTVPSPLNISDDEDDE